jgi:hypothetical protein
MGETPAEKPPTNSLNIFLGAKHHQKITLLLLRHPPNFQLLATTLAFR